MPAGDNRIKTGLGGWEMRSLKFSERPGCYSLVLTNMKIGSHFILKIFDILTCIQLFHYNCMVTFLKHTHRHIGYAPRDRHCKEGQEKYKKYGFGNASFSSYWALKLGPQNSKFFKKAVFSKILIPACRPLQWITFPHISAFWAGLVFVKFKFF